jgi:MFS family permease
MKNDFPFRPASWPFFYGWWILVVATVGIVASIPGQTMGVSVFTDSLIEHTGLSRLAVSHAYLIGTVASALALPVGGVWIDRFGARWIGTLAALGLGATLLFLTVVDRAAVALAPAVGLERDSAPLLAWPLLALGFAVLRFAGQGMLTLVSRTMLARWFERRRGLVSGISSGFVNFGFASAPLLLHFWLEAAGWRGAWRGMGLSVGLGMALMAAIFFRDDPASCGLRSDGDPEPRGDHDDARPPPAGPAFARRPAAPDFTRGQALRTAAFCIVTGAVAVQAMVGTGITFHIVSLGVEAGLSQAQAVAIFLPIAMVSTPMGFLAGAAADRLPVRALVTLMAIFQIAMCLGMAWFGSLTGWVVAIIGWGIASGCYGPLTFAAMPNLFGLRHLGAIQGAQMTLLVFASALGPSVIAALQSVFGSYRPGLALLGLLPAGIALAAPFTRTPRPPAPDPPPPDAASRDQARGVTLRE